MKERAHVMEIAQDFLLGHYSVGCFCGWEAETLWDDREDAEQEYQRHRDQSRTAQRGAEPSPRNVPIGPECVDG